MSTAMPDTSTSPLDGLVREDVIDALIDQKVPREMAESAVRCASGVTFSELYRSALDWLAFRKNNKPIASLPAKPAKENTVQTQTSSAKANGHAAAPAARICKCGCGETVPAENRFSYINGHRSRKVNGSGGAHSPVKLKRGRPRKSSTRDEVEILAAPPVAARVTLEVTEAQLNHFLVKLSLEDKRRIANHFLQSAE